MPREEKIDGRSDWRESFLRFCGPGLLAGITFGDWVRLLRDERFAVDLPKLPRALSITSQSLKNSLMALLERHRYTSLLKRVVIQPPLFILGHWRNGTTHLHNLITQDSRFGFPNSYQVSFPHTFLTTEALDLRLLSFFVPKRRPMDNVELTLESPQEDEFALCVASLQSPCLGWVFPRHGEKFEKYLCMQEVEADELERWRKAFLHFLKKVQLRCPRPLVLKSPPHTARIRVLLDLFPNARFVHIRRNPYRVFQSSRSAFRIILDWHGLQRPRLEDLDDWILRQFRQMYEAFFRDRKLVPSARFYEIAYEDLERDPVGEVRRMYEALALPDFSGAESALGKYVQSLAGYKKNEFAELPAADKARVGVEWKRCFEAWGYAK